MTRTFAWQSRGLDPILLSWGRVRVHHTYSCYCLKPWDNNYWLPIHTDIFATVMGRGGLDCNLKGTCLVRQEDSGKHRNICMACAVLLSPLSISGQNEVFREGTSEHTAVAESEREYGICSGSLLLWQYVYSFKMRSNIMLRFRMFSKRKAADLYSSEWLNCAPFREECLISHWHNPSLEDDRKMVLSAVTTMVAGVKNPFLSW